MAIHIILTIVAVSWSFFLLQLLCAIFNMEEPIDENAQQRAILQYTQRANRKLYMDYIEYLRGQGIGLEPACHCPTCVPEFEDT